MTTITETIPTFVNIPTTADPTNFDAYADNFLGTQLPAFVASVNDWAGEANTVAGEVNANAVAAAASEVAAELAETNAEAAASQAAASAASALAAPGTSATSTTSIAIGTGSKTITIQTGKSLVVGMPIMIAETAAPATNYMWGLCTAYDSGTGSLTVNVTVIGGSGTIAAWTVSLSPFPTAVTFDGLAPTTTQGDIIYHNGSGNVRLAKGTALQKLRMNAGATAPEWATDSGDGLILLATSTPSSAASVSFTNLTTTYDSYEIRFQNVLPVTNTDRFWIRLSADNGATFISSASYFYNFIQNSAGTVSGNPDDGATKIAPAAIDVLNTSGTAAATGVSGIVRIPMPGTTRYQKIDAELSWVQSATRQAYAVGAGNVDAGSGNTVTAIQFLFSTGSILSGEFQVFGVRSTL